MPQAARFVVQAFADDRDPMLHAWLRFRDAVAAAEPVEAERHLAVAAAPVGRLPQPRLVDDAPHITVWRLLAPNNRELARSARCYATPDDALAHLAALREHAGGLRVATVAGSQAERHGWYLSLGLVPVLTCSRWYGVQSASLESADAARRAMAEAPIEERVQVLNGSRRRPARR